MKPDAPAPPDYAALAKAQADASQTTAQQNAQLNRVNQVTPWGTSTWTQGTPTFNQAGYDAAAAKAGQGTWVPDSYGPGANIGEGMESPGALIPGHYTGGGGAAPNRADFTTPTWTQTTALSLIHI